MIDLFGIKRKPEPKSDTDFYGIVSAIAQFIEKVDQPNVLGNNIEQDGIKERME